MTTNDVPTDEMSKAKIVKPPELKDFEAYSHFKANISQSERNCRDPITELSYYCFTCKCSICSECGVYEHNDHLLIQRDNCLKYDTTFFNEIEKLINDSLTLNSKKESIKQTITSSIDKIKNKLNEIKIIKLKEVDVLFKKIHENLLELKKNYTIVKDSIEKYYDGNKIFWNISKGNLDLENTIFIMNFELMNLCDNKNLEVLDSINGIKTNINQYHITIEDRTNGIINQIEHYLDIDYSVDKFDDFYWDVKLRVNKYNDHISHFKSSLFDIIKRNGNYDKIKELLEIFDSKHKKGKDLLFNQEYFIQGNNQTSRKKKIRGSSKTKLLTPNKSGSIANVSQNLKESNSSYISHTQNNTSYCLNSKNSIPSNKDDIILENRIIQRFYAFSIYELYNKYFNMNKNDSISRSNSMSINYLTNWTNRYNRLKEYAKPIIGSNEVSLYNPVLNKITRVPLSLSKEEHGYLVFPEGCRHILINDILYITGGVDKVNNPLNIVLSFNINTLDLKRLDNLNYSHSYHAVEYLDNFDCIVLIGGEHNNYCEIFDIFTQKWTKMPELNFARANVNIYFDYITSDLYTLFGMKGNIVDTKNNSDSIEVLELNDIKSGWVKVDYYKSAGLNIKNNFCTVLPFTRDKLLIYGGNNPRVSKKLFALFNMARSELSKVDTETMEMIKIEEKKMRITDMALAKLN